MLPIWSVTEENYIRIIVGAATGIVQLGEKALYF